MRDALAGICLGGGGHPSGESDGYTSLQLDSEPPKRHPSESVREMPEMFN